MKANELTIGDWILCDGSPLLLNAGQMYNLACESKWANTYTFEPIPLTEEILKANGFERTIWYDNCKKMRYAKGGVVVGFESYGGNCFVNIKNEDEQFTSENGFNYFTVVRVPCFSVHELQHALRLCGLNELADNFKVMVIPTLAKNGVI